MSTVTVVPTVEASSNPPRVRLDVTDTGTPAISVVTVLRHNPDGSVVPVRTLDGGPLTLTTSGSNRVGLLYDYEVWSGQATTYSTLGSATEYGPVTVPSDQIWLVHPGVPSISITVELRAGSLMDEGWDVDQGIFWPLGREFPVVQTSGARRAPTSSLIIATDTLDELRAARDITSDASILFLNIPPAMGIGINPCYVALGSIKSSRLTTVGSDPYRAIEVPFSIVARPGGGTQATRTYADVLADNASYNTIRTKYGSLFDVLAGP